MPVQKKTSIYFAIEFSLRKILSLCSRAHLRALMTRKSCAVGIHNGTLTNHLKLFFFHFNAFVLSFMQNLVIVFLKCVRKVVLCIFRYEMFTNR